MLLGKYSEAERAVALGLDISRRNSAPKQSEALLMSLSNLRYHQYSQALNQYSAYTDTQSQSDASNKLKQYAGDAFRLYSEVIEKSSENKIKAQINWLKIYQSLLSDTNSNQKLLYSNQKTFQTYLSNFLTTDFSESSASEMIQDKLAVAELPPQAIRTSN